MKVFLGFFIGSRCDVFINLCSPNPCGERGACVQLESTFQCICLPGFTGPRCLEAINPCTSISCNNGSCATNGTNARCSCDEGFTGEYCETSMQEVLSVNKDSFSHPENCLCPKSFIVKLDELTHRNERHGKGFGGDLDGLIPDTSPSDVRVLCCINSSDASGNCCIDLSLHKNENVDCYGNFTNVCYFGLICGAYNKSINSTEQRNSGSLNLFSFPLQRNLSFDQTCYYFEVSLPGIEDDQGKKCPRIHVIKKNIALIQNHNCSVEGRPDLCLLEQLKDFLVMLITPVFTSFAMKALKMRPIEAMKVHSSRTAPALTVPMEQGHVAKCIVLTDAASFLLKGKYYVNGREDTKGKHAM